MFSAFKNRKPWAAAAIALSLGAVIAMLYLSRWRLALLYAGIYAIANLAALAGWWVSAGRFAAIVFFIAASVCVAVAGAVHAWRIARAADGTVQRHWYGRWYVLLAIIFLMYCLGLSIRTFVFEPFVERSTAMSPTLAVDDYLIVNKRAYRDSGPQRGDVILFRFKDVVYISRVIGLPGDTIEMRDGVPVINGEPVERRRIEDYHLAKPEWQEATIPRYIETLPGGREITVLDQNAGSFIDNTPAEDVAEGGYFVMGDHRDNSMDSRMGNWWGNVPLEDIVGRADGVIGALPGQGMSWRTLR